ncbi:hypothetical protein BY447_0044 [Pantoea sp. JKS000250]|uniref:Uncharacterized protein n=1 Tax=Candidatus Pantoea floridensis TaxID=1938870 RepID=A0A286C003_9GAMM|nr:hypothetical protein BX596_1636 [Enterobacteriaceae bacterium JKS000233]PXW18491.1 hypothetical protein BY447_0044 [Pantoea sp. JKS000250]SOD39734.1 hypothetical protein SAMN06273570_4188 [Pantoea floridensis]
MIMLTLIQFSYSQCHHYFLKQFHKLIALLKEKGDPSVY